MSSASSFASQRQHSHTDHADTETDSEWDRYTQDSEDEDDSLRGNTVSFPTNLAVMEAAAGQAWPCAQQGTLAAQQVQCFGPCRLQSRGQWTQQSAHCAVTEPVLRLCSSAWTLL